MDQPYQIFTFAHFSRVQAHNLMNGELTESGNDEHFGVRVNPNSAEARLYLSETKRELKYISCENTEERITTPSDVSNIN